MSLVEDPRITRVITPDFLWYIYFLSHASQIHFIWSVRSSPSTEHTPKQLKISWVNGTLRWEVFCGQMYPFKKLHMDIGEVEMIEDPAIHWCNLCITKAPVKLLEWSEQIMLGFDATPWLPRLPRTH